MFVRTISISFTVKSSSERVELSNATEGRTGCGGTGMHCRINHAGCACSGSNPRMRQSSSLMFFTIESAFSAVMICFLELGLSLTPGGCQISYMESTGCHQLVSSINCCFVPAK